MIVFLIFLLLFGCNYSRNHYHDYKKGDFTAAEQKLDDVKDKEIVWKILDRALIRFVRGDTEASLSDWEKAIDAIDYYSQHSTPELLAKTLLQDSIGAYQPASFEQTLARLYYALAFLHKGQEDNATALLYYLENHDQHNPIATYLLATLLERRGDTSNADILYSKVGMKKGASLICICHNGNVPYKVSIIAPVSIVSAAALELLLNTKDIKPALSSLAGVPVPKLIDSRLYSTSIKIDHAPATYSLLYSVRDAAHQELEKEMPNIATRSAARLLLRRGVVAAAKKQHDLVDMAMLFANLATQADTRSWATLPSRIELLQADLKPGSHVLEIDGQKIPLQINKGDLCLVHIFRLPEKTIILTKEKP